MKLGKEPGPVGIAIEDLLAHAHDEQQRRTLLVVLITMATARLRAEHGDGAAVDLLEVLVKEIESGTKWP